MLPAWDICHSKFTKNRHLTHGSTVDSSLEDVDVHAGSHIVDCCGGRNYAIAVLGTIATGLPGLGLPGPWHYAIRAKISMA